MSLIRLKKDYHNNLVTKAEYIEQMYAKHARLFEYSSLLKSTDVDKIEITTDAVVVTSKATGIKMMCIKDERRTAPIELLNFGTYEKAELDLILQLIGENSIIFDIGANIGWYACNLAKLAQEGVKVLAFEPIPHTFSYLRGNISLNRLENIEIHNFGFSNKDGELTFYFYPEGSGNASMTNLSGRVNVREVVCRVRKLDDFIAERNIEVEFIKCDVEGAELFVFQGGIKTIHEHKPLVFTEMLRKWAAKFNYHPNDIIRLFSDAGYNCYTVENGHLVAIPEITKYTVQTNFFFLHPKKHALQISKHCD